MGRSYRTRIGTVEVDESIVDPRRAVAVIDDGLDVAPLTSYGPISRFVSRVQEWSRRATYILAHGLILATVPIADRLLVVDSLREASLIPDDAAKRHGDCESVFLHEYRAFVCHGESDVLLFRDGVFVPNGEAAGLGAARFAWARLLGHDPADVRLPALLTDPDASRTCIAFIGDKPVAGRYLELFKRFLRHPWVIAGQPKQRHATGHLQLIFPDPAFRLDGETGRPMKRGSIAEVHSPIVGPLGVSAHALLRFRDRVLSDPDRTLEKQLLRHGITGRRSEGYRSLANALWLMAQTIGDAYEVERRNIAATVAKYGEGARYLANPAGWIFVVSEDGTLVTCYEKDLESSVFRRLQDRPA